MSVLTQMVRFWGYRLLVWYISVGGSWNHQILTDTFLKQSKGSKQNDLFGKWQIWWISSMGGITHWAGSALRVTFEKNQNQVWLGTFNRHARKSQFCACEELRSEQVCSTSHFVIFVNHLQISREARRRQHMRQHGNFKNFRSQTPSNWWVWGWFFEFFPEPLGDWKW